MPIETITVPVISTAHLPGDFAVADLGVLHAAYDYGYFVWMDPDNDTDWFVKIQRAHDDWSDAGDDPEDTRPLEKHFLELLQ